MKKLIIGVLILAILVYGAYRVKHHYDMQAMFKQEAAQQTKAKPSPTKMAMGNSVYMSMSAGKLGNVMTDSKDMTLYAYAKDTTGVSNCSGACLTAWPAYIAPSGKTTLPADVTVITRSNGITQYAYKGMPLYYYSGDKKAGDANGNGVGGVWSVVKM